MPTVNEHRRAISEAVATLNKALKAAHNDNLNVELDGAGTRYHTLEYIDSHGHTVRAPGYVTLYDVSEIVKEDATPPLDDSPQCPYIQNKRAGKCC